MLRILLPLLLALGLLMQAGAVYAQDGIEVRNARLELAEDGWRLAAAYDLDLNHGLEDALNRGIPLYFTTEVEITRPRWYWLDEKNASAKQTLRISYNVLTRKYAAGVVGNVQQSFNTLEEALLALRRPARWTIAPRASLKMGETYNVSLRIGLDLQLMSKPLQVNALNNSDWRFGSDRKNFSFKAEEK
ncbi:DUF4390 domain-containing protein [Massilia sp. W12]|uniref:DUF4390 domain-containing protein n=1 Tax=Massilia sp. W12 TaxID=3126507 RepID=UPI0030D1B890